MKDKIKIIGLTLLVYGIPLFIWSVLPFTKGLYGNFESPIFNFLIYGKIKFSSLGIIFDLLLLYCIFLLFKKRKAIGNERVFSVYSGVKKVFGYIFLNGLKKESKLSKEEKVSLLFYFVKLFFTPIMLKFAINDTGSLIKTFYSSAIAGNAILTLYFPLFFYLILTVDTLIFSFGYLVESPKLKNVVKSVEPTALGWLVALMCYPPFNDLSGKILGWYSSDFSNFGNVSINIITGFLSLLLFSIYVWASVALGFKASNLTNRGIVSKGPYKYVRHPAYCAKNLSWWLMGIPYIKTYGFVAIFSLAVWSFIYFLRALTEERHLSQDPDYIDYTKKVKYMFIPGIF